MKRPKMHVHDLVQGAADEIATPSHANPSDPAREASTSHGRARASGDYPVDLRVTVFRGYFVAIIAGREQRSPDRQIAERKRHPLNKLGNIVATLLFSTAIGLAIYGLQVTLGFWVVTRYLVSP
jgi:hypothetical protein